MSDFSSEGRMSAHQLTHHEEMQELLRKLAGHEGSVKAKIGRAARKLATSFSRARDLWYADPRTRIGADELEKARAAARANSKADLYEQFQHLQAEHARIAEQMQALARALERAPGRSSAPA